MNNYEFCAQWVLDQPLGAGARVLDFGCGAGHIVKELRRRNVTAHGCDVFYAGGDYSKYIGSEMFEEGVIRRMDGGAIPFETASFDLVVNNQVMEHVENLDLVLTEIRRVLKPGGKVLSLFPDKGVWREGHCGIPFVHWFPKNSRVRVFYAAALRALGFGYHKGGKSVMRWSRDFCVWLDSWTYYRGRDEIRSTYARHFRDIRHLEDYWFQLRLGRRKSLVAWLPASIQGLIVNKLGGLVFVASKPDQSR